MIENSGVFIKGAKQASFFPFQVRQASNTSLFLEILREEKFPCCLERIAL